MTRTNACVLVIVLVSGLALATSTKPVNVDSVVSNATPGEKPPVGVLFANGFTAVAHSTHHTVAHATAPTPTPKFSRLGEPVSPAEFFDRK